ncbi:Fe2+ transport system protein B [Paenibacillus endophyticus]|uniref:Fe2+ transport system protein B n=1 Tax=Paenibacillus endophyticus TaxID=1294268 RepID=A0A7W5CCP2_9BACL|nr:hypothetical protein [Paenibacillus endophyticus]MBB3155301.1 Fe2+ transport system protein B [Paenibacillus endophyticus]
MKSRTNRHKAMWSKKKIAAGIVSLTVAITATTGIAYADVDLGATIETWFNKKTEIVMESLEHSIQSETDKQKAMLKEELQLRLEASSKQLDAYTEEQKLVHAQAIEQYAAAILENVVINNEQDRKQMLDKIQVIVDSAKEAIQSLAGSYAPPQLTFVPSESQSVTDAVYE